MVGENTTEKHKKRRQKQSGIRCYASTSMKSRGQKDPEVVDPPDPRSEFDGFIRHRARTSPRCNRCRQNLRRPALWVPRRRGTPDRPFSISHTVFRYPLTGRIQTMDEAWPPFPRVFHRPRRTPAEQFKAMVILHYKGGFRFKTIEKRNPDFSSSYARTGDPSVYGGEVDIAST